MIWSMGAEQVEQHPLDFTMANNGEVVLDLRKGRNEPEHSNRDKTIRSQNFQIPTSPAMTCYPTSTYFPPHLFPSHTSPILHHAQRDSSEDGSERSEHGSVSPPSVTSPSMITSPFLITSNIISGTITKNGKPTRPFKAYPKTTILDESDENFAKFRSTMLSRVHSVTSSSSTNSKMKRSVSPLEQNQQPSSCTDQEGKDAAYWERRRKNNEAAKRSRDARRAKEDEIAIRAAFLEQENLQLKYENAALRHEAARLRDLLCNRC